MIKLKRDFDSLGWWAEIGKEKYLFTPIFRLAGDDYQHIITPIYTKEEAINFAKTIKPNKPSRGK